MWDYLHQILDIILFPSLDVEMETQKVQKGYQWESRGIHILRCVLVCPPYRKTSYVYTQPPTRVHLRMNCWSQAPVPLPPLTCPISPIPRSRWGHFSGRGDGSAKSPPAMGNPYTLIKGQPYGWCERINLQLPLSVFWHPNQHSKRNYFSKSHLCLPS